MSPAFILLSRIYYAISKNKRKRHAIALFADPACVRFRDDDGNVWVISATIETKAGT